MMDATGAGATARGPGDGRAVHKSDVVPAAPRPTAGLLRLAPVRFTVIALATALGLGYAPRAPGTCGTLVALPLWFLLAGTPLPVWGAVVVAVCLFSILVAHAAERLYGAHDVQRIVIDEVAGMLVTSYAVPFGWPEVLVAFALFRLLDMTKPQPIRLIDERVGGGLGVVLDDVAAGAVGCVALHGVRWVLGRWW